MFECTQFANPVRMPIRDCVQRQERVAAGERGLPMSFDNCVDCKQGKENKEKMKMVDAANNEPDAAGQEKTPVETDGTTEPELKACGKCKKEKPVSEFHKNKATADRLEYYCKDCKREMQKARRQKNKADRLHQKKNLSKETNAGQGLGMIPPEDEFIRNRVKILCNAIVDHVEHRDGMQDRVIAWAEELPRRLRELGRL